MADLTNPPLPPHHQVTTTLAIAQAATEHAAQCWFRWLGALETGTSLEAARAALDRAVANQAYTWAVHHAVVADLPPDTGPSAADETSDGRLE